MIILINEQVPGSSSPIVIMPDELTFGQTLIA